MDPVSNCQKCPTAGVYIAQLAATFLGFIVIVYIVYNFFAKYMKAALLLMGMHFIQLCGISIGLNVVFVLV